MVEAVEKSLSDHWVGQDRAKILKTKTKTLQKSGLKPLSRGQKTARRLFSTRWDVFDTLPAVLQAACFCSHLYSAPLHVVARLIGPTSPEVHFTLRMSGSYSCSRFGCRDDKAGKTGEKVALFLCPFEILPP